MSTFATKKLNDEKVRAVPIKNVDTRPVKGAKLYPENYANIGLIAKKKSGKTSALFVSVKRCAGPDTKIVVFCATIHKDPSWLTIREWAKSKGIQMSCHTSLKDDNGVDILDYLIKGLEDTVNEDEEEQPTSKSKVSTWSDDEEEEEVKKPKRRHLSPEWIFILDDLSTELQSKSVTSLLKKNRHFKAKIILSTQYLNDLLPAARKQLDYWILFAGHPRIKVDEIHRDADSSLTQDEFYQVYKFATAEKYSFLYVDCVGNTFRRNFDTLIEV